MLTEEIIPFDKVEVLEDGTIQIREARFVLRDGVRDPNFSPVYHRYVLSPGDDLAGRHERITAVAAAIWTPKVVTDFNVKQAAAAAAAGKGVS